MRYLSYYHRWSTDGESVAKFLREQIRELKDGLDNKSAPFGVDLLLPAVGGSARKVRSHTHSKEVEVLMRSF